MSSRSLMAASPTASCSSRSLPGGDPDLRHEVRRGIRPAPWMPRELVTVGYACSCVVFTDTVVYTLASGTKNCVTLTGQLGVVDDAHVPQRRPARSAGFGEEIDMEFTAIARRLGLFSAAATVVLLAAYAVTLTIGLLSLESPDQPIRNPMFVILEILIIVMMPAIVGLMIAVHAWAPTRLKALSFAAVVFMGLLAGLTSSLHFVILTVSRELFYRTAPCGKATDERATGHRGGH